MLLCSFQKEESVLIDELLQLDQGTAEAVRIVTIDTGVLFEETLRDVDAVRGALRRQDRGQGRQQPVQPLDRPGALLRGGQGRGPRRGARGRRGLDHRHPPRAGRRRAPTTQLIERDERRGLWKYNPLAQWTEKDLWRRIYERDLPYNPLHDQGYASIGCSTCTQPGNGREGRWAGTDKTECGLHE